MTYKKLINLSSVRTGWFSSRIKAEKASLEKIVKIHDNSKKREARKLSKMQATATDLKIIEHTKPNPVSAAQDENVMKNHDNSKKREAITGWFSSRIKDEKASFKKIVKIHDNSKKREARKLSKMQATATDLKIIEHTKPNPVSASQDENVMKFTTFLFIQSL